MNLKLILFITFIICMQQQPNVAVNEIRKLNLQNSLIRLIKGNFARNHYKFVVYVNYGNSSKCLQYYFDDLLDSIIGALHRLTIKVIYNRKKRFIHLRHDELVLLENMKSFNYFYENFNKSGNSNLGRTLMYISSLTTIDLPLITDIFNRLYKMSFINLDLIIQLADDDIRIFTFFPYTPHKCFNFQPELIAQFNVTSRRWSNNKIFPRKLDNFYGCPLVCSTWPAMPYLDFVVDEKTARIREYVGIEGKLLQFIVNAVNFTLKLHFMNDLEILESYNETGWVFRKMFNESSDFAVGAFHHKPSDILDINEAYSQTNYYYLSHIYMITNLQSDYSIYEKIAFPFEYPVWYALASVFVISSVIICCFRCTVQHRRRRRMDDVGRRRPNVNLHNMIIGRRNQTPHYYLYSLAMGGNMPFGHLPFNNFGRFLLTCWLLFTLVMRCAYQSGMYQMLRENIQHNPPQTLHNVFERNYMIATTPETQQYLTSNTLPEVPQQKAEMKILNYSPVKALAEMAFTKHNSAIMAPYEYYGYLRKINFNIWQRLHLVNERIFTQQLTFYVRHRSYLVNVMNEQISRAQFYGFLDAWKREYVGHRDEQSSSHRNNQAGQHVVEEGAEHSNAAAEGGQQGSNKMSSITTRSNNVLSMQELNGLFMILIWLHLAAVLVFSLELAWFNRMRIYAKLKIKFSNFF